MAVAERLAGQGYRVTVFERLPVIGGMMAVGIPEYRLARPVIAREYRYIKDLGGEIRLNTAIGPGGKYTLDDLLENGYRAVCLAVGAHRSQSLRIPGEELPGVVHGIDLLRAINLSRRVKDVQYKSMLQQALPKGAATRVAVLGGGNTAMDVSRSLRRLGVKDVRILYRRTRAEMPAMPEEIEDAEQEGVGIEYLISPVRVLGNEKTGVRGLECIRMKLGEPDASGRRRPVPIAGSEFVIKLDRVVLAIGQAPDLDFLGLEHPIAITRRERINVADVSFMTSRPGVFAVGDAVTTDKMVVIEAIGMGKQAAAAIDAYLKGQLPRELVVDAREVPISRRELAEDELTPIPRTAVPTIPLQQRTSTFDEVELGYSVEQAMAEAGRCLACGPCSECQACLQVCETGAIIHDQHESYHELDVGAILVANPGNGEMVTIGPGIYAFAPQDELAASAVSARVLGSLKERLASPVLPVSAPVAGTGQMGVFVCNCGDQIARVVDTEYVRGQAASLPGVVYTDVLPFACSPEAAGQIEAAIQEHGLERVVLAACSCCSLDQVCFSCTYQRMRCKHNLQGLDCASPVQFEFVNIREQCAWVHADDPQAATLKAVALVTAGIAAARAEPVARMDQQPVLERSAIIVGSGSAATACKQAFQKEGIHALRFRGLPEGVRRNAGYYQAQRGEQTVQGSTLVLAPKNDREMDTIASALGWEPDWQNLDTSHPGIFACHPDAEGAGIAASARAAAWLGRVERRFPLSARVDPERCRACSTCVKTCEFGAPSLKAVGRNAVSSWIDPAICTGCGTCVARCPSGAITAGYLGDAQLHAMLNAVLTGSLNGGGSKNG